VVKDAVIVGGWNQGGVLPPPIDLRGLRSERDYRQKYAVWMLEVALHRRGREMKQTTFILGAGFSAAAQFPLVRGLRELVIAFMQADRHAIYATFLQAGQGFEHGQFYEGLKLVDPDSQLGFEELLIALGQSCAGATQDDPRHTTLRVLRIGCARLLWQRQNAIQVSSSYENFAKRFFKPVEARNNAVVSFNWDLLIEKSLQEAGVPWQYTASSHLISVLKPHGSINWSSYLEGGGRCDYEGWRRIAPGSNLSFDVSQPLADPDVDEINPDSRYMLFPGDPELPGQNENLSLIWSELEAVLEKSEALVFIGYSLPEYDAYSRQTFQRFASGRHVEVYNPSREHLEHFRLMFGDHVQLFPQTFEESPYAQSF
jgi:hypothetical protein